MVELIVLPIFQYRKQLWSIWQDQNFGIPTRNFKNIKKKVCNLNNQLSLLLMMYPIKDIHNTATPIPAIIPPTVILIKTTRPPIIIRAIAKRRIIARIVLALHILIPYFLLIFYNIFIKK